MIEKEKQETTEEITKDIEKSGVPKKIAEKEEKLDEKAIKKPEEKPKETEKKPVKEKPKKTESFVRAYDLPVSTKHSTAVCKFIKNKKIEDAIADLEQVLKLKKAIPMKGEIPHRKGKGISSGRFPTKTVKSFIKLLKSLSANANYNGLEEPVIFEAIANIGQRPYGKFGWVRKKRTHVKITAKNMQKKKIKEIKISGKIS
jgi:ribosomal protein L22